MARPPSCSALPLFCSAVVCWLQGARCKLAAPRRVQQPNTTCTYLSCVTCVRVREREREKRKRERRQRVHGPPQVTLVTPCVVSLVTLGPAPVRFSIGIRNGCDQLPSNRSVPGEIGKTLQRRGPGA